MKAGKPGKKAAAQPAVGYLVNGVKTCTECGTQRTPMWRNGPAGPKSLCNACGVHYRKFKQLPKFNVTFKPPSGAAPVGAAPPKT